MTISVEKSALLIMDVQPGIVDRLEHKEQFLADANAAVEFAHSHDIQVIYVVVGFRAGFPEINPRNKSFSTISDEARAKFVQPQPVIALAGSDLLVTKHRVSAFSGSDLEMLLRAQNITHLVLGGIATSGVVLSTVREAADKDFQLTVLSNLCADSDADTHALLLEKLFPKQAIVSTSDEWMQS